MMTTHAMMMTTQEKTHSYIEQTPSDEFIPLAIETYGCLHFHFDSFFTAYAQTTIVHHQRSSLVPSMLVFYYGQCVHNPTACTNHNDSSTNYCTWLGFFTHHT
jgi:hypothetical protein